MIGYLGTDWCPTEGLPEKDEKLFLEMYDTAVETNNINLEYFINVQLWDGFGPDGLGVGGSNTMAKMPKEVRMADNNWLHDDIWDDADL